MQSGILLVRADASAEMGVGHVMRCVALAEAWLKTGGRATFAMAEGVELGDRIRSRGGEILEIQGEPGRQEDIKATRIAGQRLGADWLVVDGYHFSPEYIADVEKAASHFLVMADGEQYHALNCDLLVNPELDVSEDEYPSSDRCGGILLGPRYALLRREFLDYSVGNKTFPQSAARVLVTLGGGDAHNVTLRVMNALDKITDRQLDVVIVLGAANPHRTTLEFAAANSRHKMELISDAPNMPKLMAEAMFAVTAGGGTCYELAFMRVPMLLITIARNQERAVDAYNRAGIGLSAGRFQDFDETLFVGILRRMISDSGLRQRLSANAARMIDGKGAERIVSEMLSISASANKLTGTRR